MGATVTAELRERFERDGYLIVTDVFDPQRAFAAMWTEMDTILADLSRGLLADRVQLRLPENGSFLQRLLALATQTHNAFAQHFDISLPRFGVTESTPLNVGPAIFDLLRNPELLDIVEQLIGPEILSNPVQHVRIKLPQSLTLSGDVGALTRVPWHQDQGVVLPEADDTDMLTVWIPLTEATVNNGCMYVIPGSHHRGLVPHCALSSTTNPGGIPEQFLVGDRVALPMSPGSVLLLKPALMHTSLPNSTIDDVRVSLDLRYQPIGQPTGRPAFPSFVARSRSRPDLELREPTEWARSWFDARSRLAATPVRGAMSRWRSGDPLCA